MSTFIPHHRYSTENCQSLLSIICRLLPDFQRNNSTRHNIFMLCRVELFLWKVTL